jgi:hypothetical protein
LTEFVEVGLRAAGAGAPAYQPRSDIL